MLVVASTLLTGQLGFAQSKSPNDNRGASVNASQSGGKSPQSWEISRIYGRVWLDEYFFDHEVLPKPIKVPPVSGLVVDSRGAPVAGAIIVSHTPRQWMHFQKVILEPQNGPPQTKSGGAGQFGLPARTKPVVSS